MRSVCLVLAGCLSVCTAAEKKVASPDRPPEGGLSLEEDLAKASGVCLAKVTGLKEVDERRSDGNLAVIATLQIIRGFGAMRKLLNIVKAYGGVMPHPVDRSPRGPLRHDSLEKGGRYWFVFCSVHEHESGKYPQGVIAWWPQNTPKIAEVLEKAIQKDQYAWEPQYEPKTGLFYGHKAEPGKNRWRIRVWKNAKPLWEKVLQGTKADRWIPWRFWPGGDALSVQPEDCPRITGVLRAETARRLEEGNEYGLPAGKYYVAYCFDADTGRRVSAQVSKFQQGRAEPRLVLYDLKTGNVRMERAFQWMPTGGIAAGAKKESWLRKIVRRYDPKTGKKVGEEVFRYDGSRPVKIEAVK